MPQPEAGTETECDDDSSKQPAAKGDVTVKSCSAMPDDLDGGSLVQPLKETGVDNGRQQAGRIFLPETPAQIPGVRRQLIGDAFTYFLSKLVPGLMGFLSVVVFVRWLGYEQYGRYAMVFATVMAVASGTGGWLAQGILRFQSQMSTSPEVEALFCAARTGTVLSLLAGGCILALLILFTGKQSIRSVVVSVAVFAVLLTYTVTLARLQALLHSRQVLRFEILRSTGTLAISIVLLLVTGSRTYGLLLLGIGLGYCLPLFTPVVGRVRHMIAAGAWKKRASTQEQAMLSKLWRFGWPVALWLLCQQFLVVSDRYFIQRFSGFAESGIYASMYDTVVRSLSLVFTPIALAAHPLVMKHWNAGNRQTTLSCLRTAAKYQLLLFGPIALGLFFFKSMGSRLILGTNNVKAAATVLPLACGGFLWQASGLAHKPLEILCETKRMLAGISLALLLNVAGNFLLVPRFGYLASAYLVPLSALAYLAAVFVMTPKTEFQSCPPASEALPRLEVVPVLADSSR